MRQDRPLFARQISDAAPLSLWGWVLRREARPSKDFCPVVIEELGLLGAERTNVRAFGNSPRMQHIEVTPQPGEGESRSLKEALTTAREVLTPALGPRPAS